ncbi:hypothetical protein GQ53DRAFT_304952 [Thozetella sp. PMI_491]|nr:hypothetical protein GQ53DRAFT_304952 [Thozetella sp. PMI_491]
MSWAGGHHKPAQSLAGPALLPLLIRVPRSACRAVRAATPTGTCASAFLSATKVDCAVGRNGPEAIKAKQVLLKLAPSGPI